MVILHDWLTNFRGGERVLEAICELFPHAPIYTLLHKKTSTSPLIERKTIRTSFLNSIPGISTHYRKFLPLMPIAAQGLKLPGDTDLIISSCHCVIKGVKKPPGATHVCYIHSPMRYLYDQYETYFGSRAPLYQRMGMVIFRRYLRRWDRASNNNVDHFIANSHFVKKRIKAYYNLESDVVHPFVDLDDFKKGRKNPPPKEDFYLMVSAFAPNKRVDLAVEAFNKNKRPLKIIGRGMPRSLKASGLSNITFLENCGRGESIEYFFKAKGLVHPGVEDFGITPLEAMASGTPVIAYREGGVLESLDERVCEFFDHQNEESLNGAIARSEKRTFLQDTLWERASAFSKEAFVSNLKEKIERIMV